MVISCSPSATPMQDLSNTLAHTHTPTVCTHTSQSYRRQKITRDQLHLVRGTEMREEGDNCFDPIYTKKPQYLKKEVCYILCHLSHKQEILRFHVIFFQRVCWGACAAPLQTTNREARKATASQWPTQRGHTALKKEGAECRANTHSHNKHTHRLCSSLIKNKLGIVTTDKVPRLHKFSHERNTLGRGIKT